MTSEELLKIMPPEIVNRYGNPYEFTNPVNQQSGLREQTRSLWGFGGWYSNAIDVALRHDDPDGFTFLMRHSGLDKDWTTLDGSTPEQLCDKRGAEKCKRALKTIMGQREIRRLSEQRRQMVE